ncbi:MAG: ROK family protein, partial [Erysipelotrichaceae bacterium]|nr:ROK family protein [Erysipelotrichaceae bacterium]
MKYSIGIDVGGTNIRIAIVDELGNLYNVIKEKTKADSIESLKNHILSLINRILENSTYKIEGIGIGVPGPVKPDGTVIYIPNLNISDSFNLKQMIEEQVNYKVFVGNDANVAGLAEATVGNGKDYNVVQYVTLSTGIGGGLIINKKMFIGSNGLAQEIGSIVVKNGGRAPSRFKPKGCIEGEASGTALTNIANEAGLNCENAGDLFILASKGNKKAIEIKEEFIANLAAFI